MRWARPTAAGLHALRLTHVCARGQALLWERRVQLERAVGDALGELGGGGAEGAALRREAARLAGRAAEAGRAQERLAAELARAVDKREAILAKALPARPCRLQSVGGRAPCALAALRNQSAFYVASYMQA